MKDFDCCYDNCPEPGTIQIGVNGDDSHWICFRHLEKWNADHDRFPADGGGCEMQRLGELRGKRTLTNATAPLFNSSSTSPPKVTRLVPIPLTILL
jgi:hypothetical protein